MVYLVGLNYPKFVISVLCGRFLEQAIVFCCFPLALGVTHWYQKRTSLLLLSLACLGFALW